MAGEAAVLGRKVAIVNVARSDEVRTSSKTEMVAQALLKVLLTV